MQTRKSLSAKRSQSNCVFCMPIFDTRHSGEMAIGLDRVVQAFEDQRRTDDLG